MAHTVLRILSENVLKFNTNTIHQYFDIIMDEFKSRTE